MHIHPLKFRNKRTYCSRLLVLIFCLKIALYLTDEKEPNKPIISIFLLLFHQKHQKSIKYQFNE